MDDYERATSPTDSLIDNERASPTADNGFVQEGQLRGSEIIFHNIHYTVDAPVKCCHTEPKEILHALSGVMKPGLNAILGPTGSGKTSLLDILAGRKDKRCITGQVLVNGEPQPDNFQLLSGFVSQDDVVMGTLTVRENLAFSAALRLSSKYSSHDRNARVDMIIKDLGLLTCSDTRVGNDEMRGISGGERKRTNIGMELITKPDVLFLDEPTTGLDAATACSVIKLMRKQARRGKTIIFSIHQPRYSIFKLFDDITLLSKGCMVYKGPRSDSLGYFEALGYQCETYNNPADFFMDVLYHNERKLQVVVALGTTAVLNDKGEDEEKEENEEKMITLAEHYLKSKYCQNTMLEIEPRVNALENSTRVEINNIKGEYARSFFPQIGIVSKRTLMNIIRDPRGITTQVVVNIIMSFVIGGIYWNLNNGPNGLSNRVGVFFLITTNMVFGNTSAVALFNKERKIFRHECANGYYRVSSYFFAKIVCDILPMRVFPILIFSAIAYFMIGLQNEVGKFFIFTLTLLLLSISATTVCLFISSSIELVAIANLAVSLLFVFMMVFSGFLVNLTEIASWLRWLKYLSIFKYGFSNLAINELHNMQFYGNHSQSGNSYLKQQGVDIDHLWINEIALGCISAGFLILSYIQLRRLNKYV